MPAGRKPIPIDVKQVEALAGRGLNELQIAAALGIHWETLQSRKNQSSEFAEALKRGKARGIAQITNRLFEAANEGKAWAVCFYLKTVAGFREVEPRSRHGNDSAWELPRDTEDSIVGES